MTAKDQRKLIRAGFTIIRPENILGNFRIKAKQKERYEWHTLHDGFETKAAMERKISELLKNDMTVQD